MLRQVVQLLFGTANIEDGAITYPKLQNMTGLSVLGRSASSAGQPGEITAVTSGHVLRGVSGVVGFGQTITASYSNSSITSGKLSLPPEDLSGTVSVTAGGSMTVSSLSVTHCYAVYLDQRLYFTFSGSFTLGGTANAELRVSIPEAPIVTQTFDAWLRTSAGGSAVKDAGLAQVSASTPTYVGVYRQDLANWTLGTDRRASLTIEYLIA